jgi:hypothetical protein
VFLHYLFSLVAFPRLKKNLAGIPIREHENAWNFLIEEVNALSLLMKEVIKIIKIIRLTMESQNQIPAA